MAYSTQAGHKLSQSVFWGLSPWLAFADDDFWGSGPMSWKPCTQKTGLIYTLGRNALEL